jgi:hypothetical protein
MRTLAALLTSLFLASCAGSTPTYPTVEGGQFGGRPVLGISNGSTLTVTLFVNGKSVGSAAPGVGLEPIDLVNLPAMPWTVEARSSSGRVLTSMTVNSGDVAAGTDSGADLSTRGTMGRIDLSCGRITIWAGYSQPSGPAPVASAGSPGDCVP